jgi:hypothetical protein
MVEDDAFCTKTLKTPIGTSTLVWSNGIKWSGWKSISSSSAAQAGDKLSVNSSSISFQISLPSNPSQFDEVIFADHYESWGTNNVTVLRNGSFIENLDEDLILNTTLPNQIILRFEGSTWRVYSIS